MSNAPAARQLLATHTQAVLASQGQQDIAGYPFTSVVPYCLDGQGRPLVLISQLAQHTRNVQADARVSLFVQAGGIEPQAAARLSLLGELARVPEGEVAAAAARYYRFFPGSQDFHTTYDFSFWRLQPFRCHYIAGFARVHWLEPGELLQANPFAGDAEADILAHMNEDHADALPLYLHQARLTAPEDAELAMVGLDSDGFHLRVDGGIVYIAFPQPVQTPQQVRATLVSMLKAARAGVNRP